MNDSRKEAIERIDALLQRVDAAEVSGDVDEREAADLRKGLQQIRRSVLQEPKRMGDWLRQLSSAFRHFATVAGGR